MACVVAPTATHVGHLSSHPCLDPRDKRAISRLCVCDRHLCTDGPALVWMQKRQVNIFVDCDLMWSMMSYHPPAQKCMHRAWYDSCSLMLHVEFVLSLRLTAL